MRRLIMLFLFQGCLGLSFKVVWSQVLEKEKGSKRKKLRGHDI